MSRFKIALLLAAVATLHATPAMATLIMTGELSKLTVFGDTYVTTGANTTVHGNVTAFGVATTGAGSAVKGNVVAGGAANIGASIVGGDQTLVSVSGYILSGDVATTGDGSIVKGNITASGAANVGANAKLNGNLVSGDVGTSGAGSVIAGSFVSLGAGTIGANARLGGDLTAGGIATTGAGSAISGRLLAGDTAVLGVGSTIVGTVSAANPIGIQLRTTTSLVPPSLTATIRADVLSLVRTIADEVLGAQQALAALGAGTRMSTPVIGNMTLKPGVYSAPSLSTTASTSLTLDAMGLDNQIWVFNIADILSFGASWDVNIIHPGLNNLVFWNVTDGYASVGAGSAVLGTIFAKDYISIGAGATVTAGSLGCSGVYSQSSYVSTGDGAVVGGGGCAVPEPGSGSMVLLGLALLACVIGAKKYRSA